LILQGIVLVSATLSFDVDCRRVNETVIPGFFE